MSSLKLPALFDELAQPLQFAESLLACMTQLAHADSATSLQAGLVEAAVQLVQCDLAQLYLLDDSRTQLTRTAQWFEGTIDSGAPEVMSAEYKDQQLLQFCLSQNRTLHIAALDDHLYSTPFLPARGSWTELLCLPLQDGSGTVAGLMLLASQSSLRMAGFTEPLSVLGNFVMLQLRRVRSPLLVLADQDPSPTTADSRGYGLIGQSPAMQQVYRLISKVLHNPVSVLLQGETGTGKELVAKAIHEYGSRRTKPFVAQNCSALPESLLESELFGCRKGAFTGADRDRAGLFDAADGGTLFLDEIGDMPMAVQAKLLRVLQEGEVRPLGSNDTHRVDVRIVAATHHDLRERVRSGLFREDLFYRLTHFPIELPPLRERGADVRLLAHHFSDDTCRFLQRQACRWSDQALDQLAAYHFPGNVRELKGMIARALLMCEGTVLLPEHLNLPKLAEATGMTLRERLETVERNLLLDALRRNNGNQTNAAVELGLPRRTLIYRMQRLDVSSADAKSKEA